MTAPIEQSRIQQVLAGLGCDLLSLRRECPDEDVWRARKAQVIEALRARFTRDQWERLGYEWAAWNRPKQRTPGGKWETWLVLAGRGFGKTRCGVEFVREQVETGKSKRVALVAATAADTRDVMVEGESGILACSPPWFRPRYEPSKRRLTWPNGAVATLYSAEEANRLRGPQHDLFWADELAAWHNPQAVWDMLQFGLRLGKHPRGIVTTTPRAIQIIRDLVKDPTTHVTKGTMYENEANLASRFLARIKRIYDGTRLGRQEIYAEILDDNPNALWSQKRIDELRVLRAPDLIRVLVAIDPAVSSNPNSDETGIVVVGKGWCTCKGPKAIHTFTLDDRSGIYTPAEWATNALDAYDHFKADGIVGEVNNGGDLVESNIRSHPRGKDVKFKKVHATRGKEKRAEPIAGLAEQGTDHHVGTFAKLEDQMCQWSALDPKAISPDRMDAKVWGTTELMLGPETAAYKPPGAMPARRR